MLQIQGRYLPLKLIVVTTAVILFSIITAHAGTNNNVSPNPQAITFKPLSPVIYGAAPIVLSATATSGLPVSYTSSNTSVATVSGNAITIVGKGTAVITAFQNGNPVYLPAASVARTLVVEPAPITVMANAMQKIYGDTDPALTFTTSGTLYHGDTFSGSLIRMEGEAASTYGISLGTLTLPPNYTITYLGSSFTVLKKEFLIKIKQTARPAGNSL